MELTARLSAALVMMRLRCSVSCWAMICAWIGAGRYHMLKQNRKNLTSVRPAVQELSPGGSKKLTLRVLLPGMRYGFFDQSCNLSWPGGVDCVAGACDFDFVVCWLVWHTSVRARDCQ